MAEEKTLSKAQLLAAIDAGWNDFQAYLGTLTDEQMTRPTDPAGWTAKDHVAHLAIWEDSVTALLDRELRWQHMGVDHDLWESNDWDQVNAVIQQRYHNITLPSLQRMWFGIHERLVSHIKALAEADLQRPYKDFQSDSSQEMPILHWMIIDTYEHYDEHKTYIGVIVGNDTPESTKKGT